MDRSTYRGLAVVACVVLLSHACRGGALPPSLSDADFWALVEDVSEPAGRFDLSENLVSNEPMFVENARRLRRSRGVYVGVGPEQNFSYIARVRPEMAFIVDIRRENLTLHLLYKALFELANDRADFVSLVFSRPRRAGVGRASSVDEIFDVFDRQAASPELRERTLSAVVDRLTVTRRFPVADADVAQMARAIDAFFADGPSIDFWRGKPADKEAVRPSYRQLMTGRDVTGQRRSFLASEEDFAFVKALHTHNLVVPVVGDFAGPKAIRAIGEYVRQRRGAITVFYGSNVSAYLTRQQAKSFCGNLATLPTASAASFADRDSVEPFANRLKACR
jgi:hypothetical protein